MNQIKGKHAILEALKAGHNIHQILMASSARQDEIMQQIIQLARIKNIPIRELNPKEFNQTYSEKGTQHIVAFSANISHISLEDVVTHMEDHPRIVLLDHIEDPHNMGAILRSCEALGVSTILYPKDRQSTLNSTVIKTSAGAIYHLNLVQVTNTAQAATKLRQNGYWLYGADVHNGQPLSKVVINSPWVLIVGNEQKGISRPISKLLHAGITIPMKGNIESLNVSVATGIMLYQMSQHE